jgi:hypothetical protein
MTGALEEEEADHNDTMFLMGTSLCVIRRYKAAFGFHYPDFKAEMSWHEL